MGRDDSLRQPEMTESVRLRAFWCFILFHPRKFAPLFYM